MKKIIVLLLVLALGAGAYLVTAHFSGGSLPNFGIAFLGGERAGLRGQVLGFWEDVKFKDLDSAAKSLPPGTQDPANIQSFLLRIFGSDAGVLDVVSYEITTLELDSTQKRARVKTKVKANNLKTSAELNPTVMLFFYRGAEDPTKWYLEIKNSF